MKQYHSYSSQQRADIGKYAAQYGPRAASPNGKAIEAVKLIGVYMSIIKPTSANWIVLAHDCIRYVSAVVSNGFCKAGVTDAMKDMCTGV